MREKGLSAFYALQKSIHSDNNAETCIDCLNMLGMPQAAALQVVS